MSHELDRRRNITVTDTLCPECLRPLWLLDRAAGSWDHYCMSCHTLTINLEDEGYPGLYLQLRADQTLLVDGGNGRVQIDPPFYPSKRGEAVLVLLFRDAWRQLSLFGHCDEIDSQEYKRVLAEWRKAGLPIEVIAFICAKANIGTDGQSIYFTPEE